METSTETAPMTTQGGTDPVDGPSSTMATSTSTGDTSLGDTSHIHPLDGTDDEPIRDGGATPVAETPTKRTRSVGSNRHLTSLVVSLVAVPAGYGFLDYGWYRAQRAVQLDLTDLPDRVMIVLGAAAACFLLATLMGRVSALGPLVAGLVWGAGPAAWVFLDYPSFVDRLNDLPEFWNNTGFGLAAIGFALFPAVAGLLLGVAVTGKWRRPVPVSRW